MLMLVIKSELIASIFSGETERGTSLSAQSKLECSSAKSDLASLIIIFVIFFGLFLRVRQYAANRSLWLDEAMLALNIVNRSVIDLTHPLAHHQPTSLGFLIIQKIIMEHLDKVGTRLAGLCAGLLREVWFGERSLKGGSVRNMVEIWIFFEYFAYSEWKLQVKDI